MRALYVGGPLRGHGWLGQALASDTASEVEIVEERGTSAAAKRLCDESFDIVFVSHEPPDPDAVVFSEAVRASGAQHAILVLGTSPEQAMAELCYEADADGYLCVETATPRTLLWVAARAMTFRGLLAEHRCLQEAEQHRRSLERQEVRRILADQRGLITAAAAAVRHDARQLADPTAEAASTPRKISDSYRELLRTYVIMGSGNLRVEMNALVDRLVAEDWSAAETMAMHLEILEEMLQGLGTRSGRHVLNRAETLILETLVRLADAYRRRSLPGLRQPKQVA